jgi:hypothetical protein
MNEIARILSSEEVLRDRYLKTIEVLLERQKNDLGGLVLGLANAFFDAKLLCNLRAPLQRRTRELLKKYGRLFAKGLTTDARDDDQLVFLKATFVGFRNLKATERRSENGWQIQSNHLRSFRPKGAAQAPFKGLKVEIPKGSLAFFNDRRLQDERLWPPQVKGEKDVKAEIEGHNAVLYANKYSFMLLHSLLVPDPEASMKQYLTRTYHYWAWRIMERPGNIPGLVLGYNSIGGFASVNHLHFQLGIEPDGLPVTERFWKHNGGDREYPIKCRAFDSPDEAWVWVDEIHQRNKTAYNLLYTPGKVYCFERKPQDSRKPTSWSSGFAFYELSGGIITFNREFYKTLTAKDIEEELRAWSTTRPKRSSTTPFVPMPSKRRRASRRASRG